jgi:hypothetical protein
MPEMKKQKMTRAKTSRVDLCIAKIGVVLITLARQQTLPKQAAHKRRAVAKCPSKLLAVSDQHALNQFRVIDKTHGAMEESEPDNVTVLASAQSQKTQRVLAKGAQVTNEELAFRPS